MYHNKFVDLHKEMSNKFKQIALLARLPNGMTAVSNILASYFISSSGNIEIGLLLVCIIISLCFYHGGMILNDCVDLKEDQIDRPNRPLPSNEISLSKAYSYTIVLLTVGLALSALLGYEVLLLSSALLISILAYNYSSRTGFIGCFYMGLCRGFNWLIPMVALNEIGITNAYSLVVFFYVVALTLLSRDETHARRKWLPWLSLGFVFLSLLVGLVVVLMQSHHYLYLMPCLLAFIFLVNSFITLYAQYSAENIQAVMGMLIMGIIPLDALLVFSAGMPVYALLILLLIFPARLLAKQFYVT